MLPRPLPAELTEILFVLVTRRAMAKVHGAFLGDASETDVITFPYGEILICPAVARAQAPEYRLEIEHEILLYALHGLLHLAGYDDTTSVAAQTMARAQTRLLKRVLAGAEPDQP
jgi:probable rRNA maturation factor